MSLPSRKKIASKIVQKRPDIFLCHSKKDIRFVRKLAHDLHELGGYAWLDEWELGPGDSLHDSIANALEQSAYIGVVVSPDSIKSKWVHKELNQALSREGRSGRNLVIPLRIRDASMPGFLEDKLYLDFGSNYERALTQLAAYLHNLDRRRVMKSLEQSPPETIADIEIILRYAGWHDATSLGSRDWKLLIDILQRNDIHILGDRFTIYDPLSKLKRDIE